MTVDFFRKIIILSDFDGTFRDSVNAVVPPANAAAVRTFNEHGGHFTLSTGRLPSVLRNVYPEFTEIVNLPIIMSNGAILYDGKTGRMIKREPLSSEIGNKIIKDVLDSYSDLISDWVIYDEKGIIRHKPGKDVLDLNSFFFKMWFNASDEKYAPEIRNYIIRNFSDEVNAFRSWNTCTEGVSKNASKEKLIKNLVDYVLKEEPDLTEDDMFICAIGDYENDVAMLKAADLSFCPSNAIESVKNSCDYILCDESEGALAEMLLILEKLITDGKIR